MSDRHAVELRFLNGKRELLIDGEKVRGVRSVNANLAYNDLPSVTVELIPATFRYISDVKGDLIGSQEVIEDK